MKLISIPAYISKLLYLIGSLISFSAFCQEASLQDMEGFSTKEKVDAFLAAYDEVISSKPDTAIVYAQKALALSENNQYELGRANSHYSLGVAYTDLGNFELALKNLNASKQLYKSINNDKGVILCYKYIGTLYNYSGDNEKALENYIYASDLAEEIELNTESLKITNNIGMIYLKQQHFDLAIEYFLKSLQMAPEKYAESIILGNLGQAYKNRGDAAQALEYFEKGLEICREINDVSCEINQLGYIAAIYSDRQEYNKTLEYSFIVKNKLEQIGSKRELIVTYNRIGLTYQYQQQYDSSILYLIKALELAYEIEAPSLHFIHANLAMTYNDSRQYHLALNHLFKHQEIKDSLVLIDKNRQTEEMIAKYEGEKKEKEITLLKQEKELQKAELKREELVKNVAVIGSFSTLIITFIIVIIYQQKIKAQELLSIKTEEYNEQKNLELVRGNEIKAMNASIEGQERERERIAKELHDGIAGNLAGIKLNLAKLSVGDSQTLKLKKVIKHIDETYDEVRSISHHLIPPKMQDLTIVELIKSHLDDLRENHTFEIHFKYHPEQALNQLPNNIKIELYRIAQELMNNVIKHTDSEQVDIQLTKLSDHVNLMVEDNGKGFDASKTTNGIGLDNITSRVSALHGDIDVDTTIDRGTIVNINIPVTEKKEKIYTT